MQNDIADFWEKVGQILKKEKNIKHTETIADLLNNSSTTYIQLYMHRCIKLHIYIHKEKLSTQKLVHKHS
jgi:hypothetical protein